MLHSTFSVYIDPSPAIKRFWSLYFATTSRYGILCSIGDLPDDFDYSANIVAGYVMIGLGLYVQNMSKSNKTHLSSFSMADQLSSSLRPHTLVA